MIAFKSSSLSGNEFISKTVKLNRFTDYQEKLNLRSKLIMVIKCIESSSTQSELLNDV